MIVGLLSPAVPAAAAPAVPAVWDHPGYDAEDSYYNPAETVINAGTVGSLTKRWSVTLRKREGACGSPGAPLVAGGHVIAADQLGISSYQASTGRAEWQFNWRDPEDTTAPIMSVTGNVVVAASNDCHSMSDPNGILAALDLATGRPRWQLNSDMPIDNVVVDKGIVLISGVSESDAQTVIAYRATDGRELWRRAGYAASSVSAAGNVLLTRGNTSSAARIETGALLWTCAGVWRAEAATPAAERFLVVAGNALSAVDVATGRVAWTAPGRGTGAVATDGRRIYRAYGRTVEALDTRTGHPTWTSQLSVSVTQPVRAGGLLYTGGPVLNAANGVPARTSVPATSVVTGGRLLAVTGQVMSAYAP